MALKNLKEGIYHPPGKYFMFKSMEKSTISEHHMISYIPSEVILSTSTSDSTAYRLILTPGALPGLTTEALPGLAQGFYLPVKYYSCLFSL